LLLINHLDYQKSEIKEQKQNSGNISNGISTQNKCSDGCDSKKKIQKKMETRILRLVLA
jgi:hypothetical protein